MGELGQMILMVSVSWAVIAAGAIALVLATRKLVRAAVAW